MTPLTPPRSIALRESLGAVARPQIKGASPFGGLSDALRLGLRAAGYGFGNSIAVRSRGKSQPATNQGTKKSPTGWQGLVTTKELDYRISNAARRTRAE